MYVVSKFTYLVRALYIPQIIKSGLGVFKSSIQLDEPEVANERYSNQ